MNGNLTLYVDQYGKTWTARTVKELREKVGGGRVSKMYVDTKDGPKHCGYVIGVHWCSAFEPVYR
jgi:hypothetical protein